MTDSPTPSRRSTPKAAPTRLLFSTLLLTAMSLPCSLMAQQPSAKAKGKPARTQSVGLAIGVNVATPVSNIRTMNDFQVELLYSVPGAEQR